MNAGHGSHKETIEVNFCRRETERGWRGILDRFGLAAAPVWFDWLEWVLVLGAFEYLAGETGAGFARMGRMGLSAILLVGENSLPGVASAGQMIQSAFKSHPQGSRHTLGAPLHA
jgi:hypothetical protein